MLYGTYCRLGVHVGDSNITVIKTFSRKMLKASIRFTRKDRSARHSLYLQMLKYHKGDQSLVREFRL